MEKISEMIKRLCPEGVERIPFEECATYTRGITYNKKQEGTDEALSHKVLRANNITLGSNCLNFDDVKLVSKDVAVKNNQMLIANDILICAGSGSKEHVGKVAFIDEDINYTFGGFMAVIRAKANVEPRYLFHILLSNSFKEYLLVALNSTTINNLSLGVMAGFEIPLPPLPVQQEIVRILDSFTSMITNLETELASRQKQYEYYRNKLLTFDENDECVEWKTLGDIGEVRMCKRILKSQTNSEAGIPFYKIGTFGKKADAYISKEVYDEYRTKYNYPKKGDILISAAGTIGRTVEFDGTPSYFQDSNIVWIEHEEKLVTNKYLKIFYSIAEWKIQNGGSVSRLYNDNLKATEIPIPSLQRQHEIVSTLDTFESLITNIKQELEARKKQYEYYREQLLTFE